MTGGDAAENAAHIRALLGGAKGPFRDIVLLNAARRAACRGQGADACARAWPSPLSAIDTGRATGVSKRSSHSAMLRSDHGGPCSTRSLPISATRSRPPRRPVRAADARARRKRRRRCGPSREPSPRGSRAGDFALIAEIKKASPSKGLIRADFDPPSLARAYEDGGAACLSVLTDAPSFQGAPELSDAARERDAACRRCARTSCSTPIRSLEARAWGADCILIIMAAVDDETARALADAAARSSAWTCSPRCMTRRSSTARLRLDTTLIGINNRDLKTFATDPRRHRGAGAARAAGPHRRSPKAASSPMPI